MAAGCWLGWDLGGGGARALLLDGDRGVLAVGRAPWRFETAPGTAGLGLDADLDTLWNGLRTATEAALASAGLDGSEVDGLALGAVRFGSVLLDRAGEPLFATPNKDARAALEGFQLAAEHGEAMHRIAGLWPMPIYPATRLRWLRAHAPERWAAGHTLLSLGDWIAHRLTGVLATDPSQAGCTGLFDLAIGRWSDELCERLEVPRSLLPELRESGAALGGLRADAAAALSLRPGLPVSMGGGDTPCALLGAGVVEPGEACAVLGTTAPLQLVSDRDLRDPEAALWSGRHVVPGRFVLESNAGPMGESLEWMARLLFAGAGDPVARLLGEAREAEVGAGGMLSSLGVACMSARQPKLPVGHLAMAPMTMLDAPDTRARLCRSIVEGLACGVRENLDRLAAAAGAAPDALTLAGGLSRSASFVQSVADLLQQPVRHAATPDATALGAALCAATGAGAFATLFEAAEVLSQRPTELRPDAEQRAANESLWQAWSGWQQAREQADASASSRAAPFLLRPDEASSGDSSVLPSMLVTASFDEDSLARLEALGSVEYASFRDRMRLLTGETLIEALADHAVFITEIDIVDADVLARLPALRVVASCRGEAVNVDIAACSAFGIPVLNAPGRNADAVADLTLAFALTLLRKLAPASRFLHDADVAAGDMAKMGQAFQAFQGRELWRKTVGLIGFGAVGRKVAARLAPFGARVLVSDPFLDDEQAARGGALRVPLERLLRESDLVSLHAAVTEETRGLLGARELALMCPEAFLINTARAALVDEDALCDALVSGRLAGAALDTFAIEPPGHDHPLLALPNVIATPHVGGNTVEVAAHQGEIIAEDLARLLRGETPLHVRNPETLAAFRWTGPRPTPDAAQLARLREKPGPAVSDLQRDQKPAASIPAAPMRTGTEAAATAGAAAERRAPSDPANEASASAQGLDAARRAMGDVLAHFVATLRQDAAIAAFARSRDTTLAFHLIDIDLHFFLRLAPRVEAAVGTPGMPAEVQLRMSAATLDGMLAGTLNPMESAMAGDISFSGDAGKAMTIQELQADLQRVYLGAREASGAAALARALEALAPSARAPEPPRSGQDDALREELCDAVRELYALQVITATGGNVSVRIPGEPALWITPSQLFKGDLRPEVLVRIDLSGTPLDAGARSPSSESGLHCAVLAARSDANAVVHAHAPYATTLANAGVPFTPISTEAAFFGEIPRVPFLMPGTGELSAAVAEAMQDSWACLMVNHGLVVAARSLRRACDMVEIVERSAQLILGCRALGVEPPALPDDIVKQLRAMGDLVA